MTEGQYIEKKSLRKVIGKTADWSELAKDCVCFANSRGGTILVGIEDKEAFPSSNQIIDPALPFKIRKKISEHTVNVGVNATIQTAENGGQFIELNILPSSSTIASTSDGKYYYRSADTCMPLLPDELSRLFTDKPSFVWETKRTRVPKNRIDQQKLDNFVRDIKASQRVSRHVKEKSIEEPLDHYHFADGDVLTNLGVLWLGKHNDRSNLLYAPTIQFFKFDERGEKVNRLFWDDHSLNPKELIEAVWTQIPDWKEGVDVPDGMFRRFISNYAEAVVRELMANALVHRPYTMRGDVYINLHPDRLEVINPGLFPIGITPQNILHKNARRNEKLAQVFYDLHLMDKEGSGIDKIFELLLTSGKPVPIPFQGDDYVQLTIQRRISKPDILAFIKRAAEEFQLTQKELICLGLIAQHNSLSALEFSEVLQFPDQPNAIRHWLGRLLELDIIQSKGKTRGTEYFVNPSFFKKSNFKGKTNLKTIEPHRLKELILSDVSIYQPTSLGEIHHRIGKEISINKVRKMLYTMCDEQILSCVGKNKGAKYFIVQKV